MKLGVVGVNTVVSMRLVGMHVTTQSHNTHILYTLICFFTY